jgi:hypothetical protein
MVYGERGCGAILFFPVGSFLGSAKVVAFPIALSQGMKRFRGSSEAGTS